MLLRSCFLAALVSLILVGNAHAVADFSSLDGSLQFTNFGITDDESFYTFEAIDRGFKITMENGALSNGAVNVFYDVMSVGGPIVGAALSFEATADNTGDFAKVSEDYCADRPSGLCPDFILRLTVSELPGSSMSSDSGPFSPRDHLFADKDILIIGGAQISSVTQTYTLAVPEPMGAMLFGIGASVVGFTISRRKIS